MTAVPRLIEKIFDKIESKAEEFTGIKKSFYKWSISTADRFSIEKQNGIFYNLKLEIAKFLVFSKWKSALGGSLELICSGSAPLQPRLAKIFTAAGIQIIEGYGLTENSAPATVSWNDDLFRNMSRFFRSVGIKTPLDFECSPGRVGLPMPCPI